jgi:hypothetical protein
MKMLWPIQNLFQKKYFNPGLGLGRQKTPSINHQKLNLFNHSENIKHILYSHYLEFK